MDRIPLAIVGCGGMGHRHFYGLVELEELNLNPFQLAAVCDRKSENASSLAAKAEAKLKQEPKKFDDFQKMLKAVPEIAAVDICTEPPTHHTLAIDAMRRGVEVLVEKPMALTVKACNLMTRAASETGAILSVAENYRRDPMARLAKALIEAGAVGDPRLLLHQSVGGGDRLLITPWRHKKNVSGLLLDVGVHYTDMIEYLLGAVTTVYAQARLHEKARYGKPSSGIYQKLHPDIPDETVPTAEDACYAILSYESGAVCHYTEDHAGHGAGFSHRCLYGAGGSMELSGARSGRPVALYHKDGAQASDEDILEKIPDFRLDTITARLFGAERLLGYELPFEKTDAKLLAVEHAELAECIRESKKPEVDGEQGARAVALVYAMLESSTTGEAVRVDDVLKERLCEYQREIDTELGLT